MNISHIKEFVYLTEKLNFSETARRFYLSQSTLSKHIAALEEELGGGKLFVRDSRNVSLTRIGKIFYEDAIAIVNDYDRAVTRVAAATAKFGKTVRIGFLRHATRPFLAAFCEHMKCDHPDIDVNLIAIEYSELYSAIKTHKVDLALGKDVNPLIRKDCNVFPVYTDRLEVVVGHGHPLAQYANKGVTTEILKGKEVRVPNPTMFPGLCDLAKTNLPDECDIQHYDDVDTMIIDIELGSGIALSPAHNVALYGTRVHFIPVIDKQMTYNVGAIWLKETETDEIIEGCLDALRRCRS